MYDGEMLSSTASQSEHKNEKRMDIEANANNVVNI
jgi:hypothetical protein